MILLWGLAADPTMASVRDRLDRRRAEAVFVPHSSIARCGVRFDVDPRPRYTFRTGSRDLRLDEVSAAYLRPFDHRDYADTDSAAEGYAPSGPDLVHHLIGAWAEHTGARVINRPSAEATNHSKLYQALHVEAAGLLAPESLVTNDPDAIRAFGLRHDELIFKSMSGVRSIVRVFDPDALVRLGAIGPVLFQQRVIGHDVRVHVVGERVLACRIDSEGVDYRYATSRMEPIDLPEDVSARCVALARSLGLIIAGIDLIVTPGGDWYCLEANPNPAFSHFDGAFSGGIADAVADLLTLVQQPPLVV